MAPRPKERSLSPPPLIHLEDDEKMKSRYTFPVLTFAAVAQLTVVSQHAEAAPRFKPGELVFSGAVPAEYFGTIKKYYPRSKLTVVSVPPGREIAELKRNKNEGFSPDLNYIAKINVLSEGVNDPFLSYQWNMQRLGVPELWGTATGAGVKVAVIDTGIAEGSDGVNLCAEPGYDFAYDDTNPNDKQGHGTHVSGTIAQNTNNAIGVVGLAPESCVIPIKALDDRGSGDFTWITEAIHYAIDNGANVINMSLGAHGVTSSSFMGQALARAESSGVVVVAAAGNDGDLEMISYPAIYPTVLSVGSTGIDDSRAGYSNGGPDLDVVAPGGNTSVDLDNDGYVDGILQETFSRRNWGYYFYQGTSMASPHVAAVAALMREKDSNASPADIRERLRQTAIDIDSNGRDDLYGFGLVDPAAALASSLSGNPTEPLENTPPVASFSVNCTDLDCTFDGSNSSDSDGSIQSYSWGFGDGSTGSGTTVSHTYGSAGTYTVTLSVTDDSGLSASINTAVSVTAPNEVSGPSDFSFTGTVSTRGKTTKIVLNWDQGVAITLTRNGSVLTTNDSSGSYTDNLGKSPSGTYTYQACEVVPDGACFSAIETF